MSQRADAGNASGPRARVSVVVPSFNCGGEVLVALRSIAAQGPDVLEVIVVDDGSTDDTAEVLRPLVESGAVRYLQQQNRGVSAARNTGILAARGELVALLDADDQYAPAAISTMVAALDARPDAHWCVTDLLRVTGDQSQVIRCILPPDDLLDGMLKEDFVTRGVLFRRKALLAIGLYDESLSRREDWDLHLRLIVDERPFVYVPEPLYRYRHRERSLMTSGAEAVLDNTARLLGKHHRPMAAAGDLRARRRYAENLWELARRYWYDARRPLKAARCVLATLACDRSPARLLHALRAPSTDRGGLAAPTRQG